MKSKPFIIINIDPRDQSNIKIIASNKVDAGEMTQKFELFNKQYANQPNAKGNHLLLFDGAKQQVIKLDASIGVKQAAKDTIKEAAKAPSPPVGKSRQRQQVTYDENSGLERAVGELVDPARVISNNKQQYTA